MTALEQFASYVAGVGKDGLPASTETQIKLHATDIVCAWLAGSGVAEGRALLGLDASLRGSPGLASYGDSVFDKVMTAVAVTRLSEIDDIHPASGTTPGSIIVPAVLTIAAAGKHHPRDVIAAIVAGYDAMIRLGLALGGPSILYRGIWPTYFAAPFGVAAAAARLLGLSASETAHALGVALTLSAPGVGHHGGPKTSRWLAAGHAARNGAMAAFYAKAGYITELGLLEGPFFSSIYTITPDLAALTAGLDGGAVAALCYKPWCGARQTQAAAQGLKEIIAAGVAPEAIEEITVSVPGLYHKMIDHGVISGDRTSHLTSASYQLALAALAPDAMYDVVQTPAALAPAITAFMSKVKIVTDDWLGSFYPKVWPARISVVAHGVTQERLVTRIPGDAESPFDAAQIAEKFRRVAGPIVGADACNEVLALTRAAFDRDDGLPALVAGIEQVVRR